MGTAFGSGIECGGCKAVMPDQTFVMLYAVQVNWDSTEGVNIGTVRSRGLGEVGLENVMSGKRKRSPMTDIATNGSLSNKQVYYRMWFKAFVAQRRSSWWKFGR